MKTSIENIVESFKDKKILFLENDNGLYNGLDVFEDILNTNNIENKAIYKVGSVDFQDIIKAINENDVIVFQTQWIYDISGKIKQHMMQLRDKKSVVEVYMSEPTWYYKLDVIHNMYIFQAADNEIWPDDDHMFYKLSDLPYWDYENKFDK